MKENRAATEGIMILLIGIIAVALLFGLLKVTFRLAWGLIKIMFGVGLFVACPILFIIAAALGLFGSLGIVILIIAVVCLIGMRKTV